MRRAKLDHPVLQDPPGLLDQAPHRQECRSSPWRSAGKADGSPAVS